MNVSEVSQKNTKDQTKNTDTLKAPHPLSELVNCGTIHFSPPKEEVIDSAFESHRKLSVTIALKIV